MKKKQIEKLQAGEGMASSYTLLKALSSETKMAIFCYLLVYNELTLEKLSELLRKSKSTVHHHIQHLLTRGVVEEGIKPGSKTKYYKLTLLRLDEATDEVFDLDILPKLAPEERLERLEAYLEIGNATIIIMQTILKLILDYHKKILLDENLSSKVTAEKLKEAYEPFIASYFASAEQVHEFQQELRQLIKKYYWREVTDPNKERPFAFYCVGVNLKDILDKKYRGD